MLHAGYLKKVAMVQQLRPSEFLQQKLRSGSNPTWTPSSYISPIVCHYCMAIPQLLIHTVCRTCTRGQTQIDILYASPQLLILNCCYNVGLRVPWYYFSSYLVCIFQEYLSPYIFFCLSPEGRYPLYGNILNLYTIRLIDEFWIGQEPMNNE